MYQVKNDIASAIFRRVVKVTITALIQELSILRHGKSLFKTAKIFVQAHKSGETFRVFILIPLLPAFEGDVSGDSGTGIGTSRSRVTVVRYADNNALPVPVNLPRLSFSHPTPSRGGLSSKISPNQLHKKQHLFHFVSPV